MEKRGGLEPGAPLPPSAEVLHVLRELIVNKGWKGYISLWDESAGKAFLLLGNPLDKFAVMEKK